MKVVPLNVARRDAIGTRAVKALRAQGKVPAVVYGTGGESIAISLDLVEIEEHMRYHHKVFRTNLGGKEEAVLLKDVQFEATTDTPQHIDLLRIDLTKPVTVPVQLVYVGHAIGLNKGGRLIHDIPDLPVTCLPTAIPESIEVPVSHLEIGMGVQAKEVKLPEGVKLAVSPDAVVCHVILHVEKVVAPVAAAAVEGAVPAEGEAAPPAAATAAPAAGAAAAKPAAGAPAKPAAEKPGAPPACKEKK
jgi:large subunit ribosomal protein L25